MAPDAMWVDALAATGGEHPHPPILFLHGGAHTSACYRATPDGRQGWADYVAAQGWPAVVADWPGHGRSPRLTDLATLSGTRVVAAVRALLERIGPVSAGRRTACPAPSAGSSPKPRPT